MGCRSQFWNLVARRWLWSRQCPSAEMRLGWVLSSSGGLGEGDLGLLASGA